MNTGDLLETLEEIRQQSFPDLAADLVAQILELEAEHVEDRGPAPRRVESLIDAALGTRD